MADVLQSATVSISEVLQLQELERHPRYIQEFYQYMLDSGLSPFTVIRHHVNVRKCLQHAFQLGLIKSNPADRVEKHRKNKYEATIYNNEELDKLFKVVKEDPLELAVILGAFYGLRHSEVVGLKWDAIDFERKTISIRHTVVQFTVECKTQMVQKDSTKTKSSCRTLPLVAPFELLLRYLKAEQTINQRSCGNCYGMKQIRFHDLQHSCASLFYANGVPLKDIQEWLGHSDIGITSNIYTHMGYSNKISFSNASLPAYPKTYRVGAVGQ